MKILSTFILLLLISCSNDQKPQNMELDSLKRQENINIVDNDTIKYNLNIDDDIIHITEIPEDAPDYMNDSIIALVEKKVSLLSEDTIKNWEIGKTISTLLKDHKIIRFFMRYKVKNNKSIFYGCRCIFNYNKQKDYDIYLSLYPNDYIITEKICCQDDIMIQNPNLVRSVFNRMLNKRYQLVSQKLIPIVEW